MAGGYTAYRMTEPRKAALSLLITTLLFAAFTVVSFAGLFDLIETRFYNPSVTSTLSRELSHEAGAVEVFLTSIERWFGDSLADPAVKRSFLAGQTSADIYERSRIFARLHEKLDGLQWVRLIDAGGNHIHYSTWQGDLIREDSATAVYRMYTEVAFYTPLEQLLPLPGEDVRILFDPSGGRIVFSLPFYDTLDVCRGPAVFSLSLSAIQTRLIAERTGGPGKIWLVAEPRGFLRNVPEDNMTGALEAVAENWKQSGIARQVSVAALESGGSRTRLVLLTAQTLQGIYVGNLVNETVFVFPLSLKIVLLVLFFISVFLVVFLITHIRHDPMAVVQNRLKNLQINLIKEYYDQKTDVELGRWGMDLMQWREEIWDELKSGLKTKAGEKWEQEIDAYIEKSWNDLLAVIGGRLERTVNEEGTADADEETGASGEETAVSPVDENPDRPVSDTSDEEAPGRVPYGSYGMEEPAPLEDEVLPETSAKTDGETAESAEELEEIGELEEIEELETIEETGELEEIGELETIEETGELEERDDAETPSPIAPSRVDSIAWEIEWSEESNETEEPLALEIEVSTPFSTLPHTQKHVFTEKQVFDDDATPLKDADSSGVPPLLYQPFTQTSLPVAADNGNRGLARKASLINMADKPPADAPEVIREQGGIAYIREAVLHPTADEEKYLDPRMKGLVDSVLKHAEKEF
jgi:hypothetical protein